MNGFIKLQRRFFSHWLWTGERRSFSKAEAFLDLLQLAVFTRTKMVVGNALFELEPGELCGSERFLSGRWGWSTKKVRAFLMLLEGDQMVALQKKHRTTVITLLNYTKYSGNVTSEEAAGNQKGIRAEAVGKQIEEGEKGKRRKTPFERLGASSDVIPDITWSPETGFEGISPEDRARWKDAYPAVDIPSQIARAGEWLRANPAKRKKAVRRYLTNWLARAQERGGDIKSNSPDQTRKKLL